MNRRAIVALLILAGACRKPEAARDAAGFCGVAPPAPAPYEYVPQARLPWPLNGSDWEKSLNHTRAIGKEPALLRLAGNARLRITVEFMPESSGRLPAEAEMKSILDAANAWAKKGHVQFDRVKSGGSIRIRLTNSAVSFSAIGRESAVLSRFEPTMQLGVRRTLVPHEQEWIVRHEFGHALGLVHEHQNATTPQASTICWNKPVIRQALGAYVDVDDVFFKQFTGKPFTSRAFDPASVMVYHAPPAWTCDGKGLPMNYQLSSDDEKTIAELYPARGIRN